MKKVRVFGHVNVVVTTVVDVEDNASEEGILQAASKQFTGVHQLVGNGGCGDKMVGVYGPDDTIMVDESVEFDDFSTEV